MPDSYRFLSFEYKGYLELKDEWQKENLPAAHDITILMASNKRQTKQTRVITKILT